MKQIGPVPFGEPCACAFDSTGQRYIQVCTTHAEAGRTLDTVPMKHKWEVDQRPFNRFTIQFARKRKVADKTCRVCGGDYYIEAHHVAHKSKIGGKHPLVHHPDNVIPLCHGCHQNHHTTAHRRVPRSALTAAEIAFVIEHASESWLELWYPTNEETNT